MSTIDELYTNIGTNAISSKYIANKLVNLYQKQIKQEESSSIQATKISLSSPTDKQIQIKGLNNVLIKFAGCCKPMYGDSIVGFISAGRGIIIHRSICPNLNYFDANRIIDANWKPLEEKKKSKKSKN